MIDRLRTLSPLLMRYSAYVAAALLMFFVAVGVGATAAVVVGWQFERTGTADNAGGTSAPETGQSETTAASRAPEGTAIESSGGSNNDATPEASFVHRATEENSRGDFTYIDDPSIDGDPDAVVLASPVSDESSGGASYGHNIGVWYEGGAQTWAIFNQDLAPVPPGAAFEVVVSQQSMRFVHHADLLNTVGNYTYLDNQLTNGEPDAVLSVTQNWNPGWKGRVQQPSGRRRVRGEPEPMGDRQPRWHVATQRSRLQRRRLGEPRRAYEVARRQFEAVVLPNPPPLPAGETTGEGRALESPTTRSVGDRNSARPSTLRLLDGGGGQLVLATSGSTKNEPYGW